MAGKHFLTCSDLISVRLKGGNTTNEGFIEITASNGTWGGICDDHWDKPDADVVCRMLGYPFAEIVYVNSKPFGHGGHGNFVFDDLKCVGNETSVFDCPAKPEGEENCGSSEWAGVKCCESGFYGPTCANQRGSRCALSGWKTFSNLF